MINPLPYTRTILLTLSLAASLCRPAAAQEVVGVLSSSLGPYTEAFEGFQETFAGAVPVYDMSRRPLDFGRDTRVVVAFGGRAALADYPDDVTVVYCLAPGIRLEASAGRRAIVKVEMLPPTSLILDKIREIQPDLRRLTIFWSSDAIHDQIDEMSKLAKLIDLNIETHRVGNRDELPDRLRSALGHTSNAIWLPPDPLLINARSVSVLKAYSWANDIPLYVSTAGLVEHGAVAGISCSFREIGRTAGIAARNALNALPETSSINPGVVETTLNLTAAGQVDLPIPDRVSDMADKVIP